MFSRFAFASCQRRSEVDDDADERDDQDRPAVNVRRRDEPPDRLVDDQARRARAASRRSPARTGSRPASARRSGCRRPAAQTRCRATSDSPIAPASVSMWPASESSASEWARMPTTTSPHMNATIRRERDRQAALVRSLGDAVRVTGVGVRMVVFVRRGAQQASQQPSPRQLSRPSLTATAAITSAASRIGPPPPGECVRQQSDEERDRQVGAELVLGRLLDRRRRVELAARPAAWRAASSGIVGR